MLREVSELPKLCPRGRDSFVSPDILAFVESGMPCAEIVAEGKAWRNVYQSARDWVRRHRDLCHGVRVTRRGERVFLVREVGQ